ncbi:MAG: methyltransferase family protein [Verrucomicrobiales bacterium]
MITRSDRGTRWVVVQMALLAALAVTAPLSRGGWPALASTVPAALLFLYAVWTGVAGVRELGRNLTPRPTPKLDGSLVTTGIYARVRHPLYASLIALGLGWALAWSSLPAVALAIGLAGFLHAKARHEEKILVRIFHSYFDYMTRVPRYVPRLPQR